MLVFGWLVGCSVGVSLRRTKGHSGVRVPPTQIWGPQQDEQADSSGWSVGLCSCSVASPARSLEMSARLRVCVFSYNKKCLQVRRNLTRDSSANEVACFSFLLLISNADHTTDRPTDRPATQLAAPRSSTAAAATATSAASANCSEIADFPRQRKPSSRGSSFMSSYLILCRLLFCAAEALREESHSNNRSGGDRTAQKRSRASERANDRTRGQSSKSKQYILSTSQ